MKETKVIRLPVYLCEKLTELKYTIGYERVLSLLNQLSPQQEPVQQVENPITTIEGALYTKLVECLFQAIKANPSKDYIDTHFDESFLIQALKDGLLHLEKEEYKIGF